MNWKDEFLEKYFAQDVKTMSEALELKQRYIPGKLYRYRTLNNLNFIKEEICDGKIFLAHPKDLNDPFDSCSVLAHNVPKVYFGNKANFQEQFRGKIPEKEFCDIFKSEEWYEKMMLYVALESVGSGREQDLKNAMDYAVMKQIEQLNNAVSDMVRNSASLACFTETNTNLPMWNHYAQGHTGICLEYDTKCIEDIYITNRLFPVIYTKKLPDGVKILTDKEHSKYHFMEHFLIHKLNDWRYEQEWRLIFDAGSWYYSLEQIPEEYWSNGKQIMFIKPSRIFLGVQVKEENEKKIREWGKQLGIPVLKMQCTEYGLRVEE